MINVLCPIYTLVFYQCKAIATVLQYRTAFYGVFLRCPQLTHMEKRIQMMHRPKTRTFCILLIRRYKRSWAAGQNPIAEVQRDGAFLCIS
jgi:hypothetical protein